MVKYHYSLFLCCMISFLIQSAYGLETDKDKPLYISADSATLNRQTGINIFKGNAKVDQGSTHVRADTITAYLNKQRKPIKIIATGHKGKPAHYQTLPKPKQKIFDAWAKTIKYFPQKRIAYLVTDAVVHQAPNTFTGPMIRYDIKNQIVKTYAAKNQRTTIVLYPNKVPS